MVMLESVMRVIRAFYIAERNGNFGIRSIRLFSLPRSEEYMLKLRLGSSGTDFCRKSNAVVVLVM